MILMIQRGEQEDLEAQENKEETKQIVLFTFFREENRVRQVRERVGGNKFRNKWDNVSLNVSNTEAADLVYSKTKSGNYVVMNSSEKLKEEYIKIILGFLRSGASVYFNILPVNEEFKEYKKQIKVL